MKQPRNDKGDSEIGYCVRNPHNTTDHNNFIPFTFGLISYRQFQSRKKKTVESQFTSDNCQSDLQNPLTT